MRLILRCSTWTQILPARLWSVPRKFEHSSRQGSFLPHHLYPHSGDRQTCTGRSSSKTWSRNIDHSIRTSFQYLVVWSIRNDQHTTHSLLKYNSGTCNNHIGMGVRYNAEKKKIGAYFSTPIFSFRCKCHLCDGWFEIQTDPKVRCALCILGLKLLEICRIHGTSWPREHDRRTKTGTQKLMEALPFMVSQPIYNWHTAFSSYQTPTRFPTTLIHLPIWRKRPTQKGTWMTFKYRV